MAKLDELAKKLASLGDIPREAVAAGAEFAEKEIKSGGRANGPLREGNAVAASVTKKGDLALTITRVHAKDGHPYGVRNDFLAAWIVGAVVRAVNERMNGR